MSTTKPEAVPEISSGVAPPSGAEFAQLGPDRLAEVVRQGTRSPAHAVVEVLSCRLETVPYEIGTISTCALLRASGEARIGAETRPWSAFVKVLQSAQAWPLIDMIPAQQREQFLRDFPWRLEIEAHESPLRDVLPDGMRLPQLYTVAEVDDLHAAMWMEDVAPAAVAWDLDRFARAAMLLGELAGRRPVGSPAIFGDPTYALDAGCALRMYAEGRVVHWAAGAIRNDAIWGHPAMQAVVQDLHEGRLRADLLTAVERLPELFSIAESLPATYVHGDASPQNLLAQADEPDEFVVIDWGFNCPLAVGFDLGQLLVGLAHAGELDVNQLAAVHETIVPAYVEGMARANIQARSDDVLRATSPR